MFYLVLFMQKVLYDSYTLYVYSMNPSLFTVQGTQGLTEVDFWEKTIAARAPLFIMLPCGRYTVEEGYEYSRVEDQTIPISTPNIYNKFGIEDGYVQYTVLPSPLV